MGIIFDIPKGGEHPGPPPGRQIKRICRHEHFRLVCRIFEGKNQPPRYGFQCLGCGHSGRKLRDGSLGSCWLGAERWIEELEIDPSECVTHNDAFTREMEDRRRQFYDDRRAERESPEFRQKWWDWYNKYLRSAAWQERRQAVLKRDRHQCQHCGKGGNNVHHLSYRFVGEEPLEDLLCLCEACHRAVHDEIYE